MNHYKQELPPWLREQILRSQQIQQNLDAIMMKKQQIEQEIVTIDRVMAELEKTGIDDCIYKSYSHILIKSMKGEILKELEGNKKELNTRKMVVEKQESRVRDNLKEVENKISKMMALLHT
jgi:prefoldin beta subunit